ncbi:MAG: SDR family oxidoreductase [Firmicutes bacterium]|nr:SDR family oxidoreductase [Bacillota bacterium]
MKKTALITGASGGIGYELAKLFAKDEYDLVLVARNVSRLNEIKYDFVKEHHIDVTVIPKDLSIPSAAEEIYSEIDNRNIVVDVLVNNAGVADFNEFHNAEWERQDRMIQIHVASLTHLTKLFLDRAVRRKTGRILNVASTAAFCPGPLMAVYYATKAYILSFSEAIAFELKGTGITVTTLCPGPTQTGIVEASSLQDSKLFKSLPVADAKSVADYGYKALMRGKKIAVPGLVNKLIVFSGRLSPRNLITYSVSKIQKRIS